MTLTKTEQDFCWDHDVSEENYLAILEVVKPRYELDGQEVIKAYYDAFDCLDYKLLGLWLKEMVARNHSVLNDPPESIVHFFDERYVGAYSLPEFFFQKIFASEFSQCCQTTITAYEVERTIGRMQLAELLDWQGAAECAEYIEIRYYDSKIGRTLYHYFKE